MRCPYVEVQIEKLKGIGKKGALNCILGKASISALLTFLDLFWFSSKRETILEAMHLHKTPRVLSPVNYRYTARLLLAQGAKKVSFTACHSNKLLLLCTSPRVFVTSVKNFLMSSIDYSSSVI